MVLSQLDYGNAILVNLPKPTLKPQQSIPNHAVKVTCKKQKYDSSTDCLSTLQWLPVHYRCIYKPMTIVYKTLQENEPQYLADKFHITTVDRMTRYQTTTSTIQQEKDTRGQRFQLLEQTT